MWWVGKGSRGSMRALLVCVTSRLVMGRSSIGVCLLEKAAGGSVAEESYFVRGRL